MPQINWIWNDSDNRIQTYQLSASVLDTDKSIRIGRDQQKCELWLNHNTVSRVHAEVSFKPEWQRFYLRNLVPKNPVRIDGGLLIEGEVALYEGSMIQFGQLLLQVSNIVVDDLASHAQHLHNPHAHHPHHEPVAQPAVQNQAPSQTSPTSSEQSEQTANVAPKLLCPKCQTLQLLSLRNSNCPVCGHFLADASSRYFFK